MKKIDHLKIHLAEWYGNQLQEYPQIILRTKEGSLSEEGFFSHYSRKSIYLESNSSLAAVYGLHHLFMGLRSGHLAECLGEWHPRFSLRPLWIGCHTDIGISQDVCVALPHYLCNANGGINFAVLDDFCARVLELGYNSVIFGKRHQMLSTDAQPHFDWQVFCTYIQEYGLKVILKPQLRGEQLEALSKCPLDPNYRHFVQRCLQDLNASIPMLNAIFWESESLQSESCKHPLAQEATQQELALAEISMIEAVLPDRLSLIYFLSASDFLSAEKQTTWFASFCDEVGPRTILSFSAVAGDPTFDHLAPHPAWEMLRQCPDSSSTCLLPIINIGAVHQGEGLWPALTGELTERYLSRCQRHSFIGAISLVNQLPAKGAMLDCNLWTASQLMWKERSAPLLMETWFAALRPDFNYGRFKVHLEKVNELVMDLSTLRSWYPVREGISTDECRALAESMLAKLKFLQVSLESDQVNRVIGAHPSIHDYCQFFLLDARRLIKHFLKTLHISMLHVKIDDEAMEGFWTHPTGINNFGIFSSFPARGLPGSMMERIYCENRLY